MFRGGAQPETSIQAKNIREHDAVFRQLAFPYSKPKLKQRKVCALTLRLRNQINPPTER